MASFGKSSDRRLNTCAPEIRIICYDAIEMIDFSVVTGHRTKEKQNALYPRFTKLKWPDGKHNSFPSRAIDIVPYIQPYGALSGNQKQKLEIQKHWEDRGKVVSLARVNNFILKSYARLMGYIEAVAYIKGIDIRIGMDWDGDFDTLDQSFHDLGHWELK